MRSVGMLCASYGCIYRGLRPFYKSINILEEVCVVFWVPWPDGKDAGYRADYYYGKRAFWVIVIVQ